MSVEPSDATHLVDGRRAENVDIRTETLLHPLAFDDPTARLDQEFATLCTPTLLEVAGCSVQSLACEIVKHDNVRTGGNSFIRLGFRLAFDRDEERKAGDATETLDRFGNRPCSRVSVNCTLPSC
jgi:hypothetical protein